MQQFDTASGHLLVQSLDVGHNFKFNVNMLLRMLQSLPGGYNANCDASDYQVCMLNKTHVPLQISMFRNSRSPIPSVYQRLSRSFIMNCNQSLNILYRLRPDLYFQCVRGALSYVCSATVRLPTCMLYT